ncbi:TetR/AcrR family transcriptional regulator C-terminal domain-containing protein [Gordonia hydrophobica]|uniref:TetR/AcrR family transcriptional regulator C-terminal domain-containing protein n=1 Tax=Gordonia hydrophobica TaxID=40516 RepID=A0ABZ2TZ68_9ACTN|nr:TetR/AcrR family transcriptional regulator C-terminal domain-containing protein [Gordonia hydrophobica]MBM7367223.1 AcrR family transcriptional regulator [Gordonia hydrophobica]
MVDSPGHDVPRIVELLWNSTADVRRPGPRQRASVPSVVRAAIELADTGGLGQVSMRSVAERVGLKPMGVYTYVPSRTVLIALMVDAVAVDDDVMTGGDLAACLRQIADQYRDELLRHPWLLDVPAWRPIPGPGSSRRYEQQLAALEVVLGAAGQPVDDVELDAIIAVLKAFATGNARLRLDQAAEFAQSGLDDAQWWEIAGPLLADAMPAADYPVSSRVGSTVGELFAGPGNADHAYEFGLKRLIDGLVGRR